MVYNYRLYLQNMNNTYKQIGHVLESSGLDGISYGTETVTDTIKYISFFCPAILIYSKIESIKKILTAYSVSISSNTNIEMITIKLIE